MAGLTDVGTAVAAHREGMNLRSIAARALAATALAATLVVGAVDVAPASASQYTGVTCNSNSRTITVGSTSMNGYDYWVTFYIHNYATGRGAWQSWQQHSSSIGTIGGNQGGGDAVTVAPGQYAVWVVIAVSTNAGWVYPTNGWASSYTNYGNGYWSSSFSVQGSTCLIS